MITPQEVEQYRDIYYGHVKPLLRQGYNDEPLKIMIQPIFDKYGWTWQKFRTFQIIDLMQRFEYIKEQSRLKDGKEPKVKLVVGSDEVGTENAFVDFPELRCPIRSEEKRNLN